MALARVFTCLASIVLVATAIDDSNPLQNLNCEGTHDKLVASNTGISFNGPTTATGQDGALVTPSSVGMSLRDCCTCCM